ncbi:hypothetical protein F2Q70_00011156 [Brassica cretica]|uniref:Aspartic peptidase DDI1-type domain-containing protein n=1 Tax=Brassica cretica TaxID=69181 RepID=A0A8S9LRM8_BRACR|nr:hypothetical protein F2Q68_00025029 [Brassica cretica]KAF2610254.1 hypothetical protein F2Q70_00011156 [Brassica cretica]
MMLEAQVSQTAEDVKKQEALVKGKAMESERHQVNTISDDDFGEVLEQEKLEEDAFLVESCMSIGSSYWCQPTSTAEHRPTLTAEHRSISSAEYRLTPLLGSDKTVRIQSHSDFATRHLHPPTLARVKKDNIDRQQHNRSTATWAHRSTTTEEQQSTTANTIPKKISQQSAVARQQKQTLAETSFVEIVDRRQLPGIDRRHLPGIDRHQTDGYEPAMGKQATKEEIPVEKRVKSWKPYIPKHLRREVNKEELKGFHKRVKRVPKDMSFEDLYHKYRLGNFFRESRETDKDIELIFSKVSRKPKRTLKKEQDPGKFLIPCSIHSNHLPNALCDTGSAVSIMAIDTSELLGLKMEPSKDSFTFVDSSRVNSAGMIKNVKMEIGECIIPVDFHVM